MYLEYYGFSEKPFTITPNPRFIFFSKIHKEAFALLLYGISNHFGFIELTGEVGTGKTTVLRTLLGQLDEETHRIALIFNPSPSAVDLLRAVNREYGIPDSSDNIAELLGELNRFLIRENTAGRTVVLVIDEAQNLAPEVLEQIRLISNLETDQDKLIQIVLAGQPELGRILARPELRQLNQRIALRYHLKTLGREEVRAYIEHRLHLAGGSGRVSFSPGAIRMIRRYSRGSPRLINMLCDRALLIGYTEESRKISARAATLSFRDIMLKPSLAPFVTVRSGVVVVALMVLASLFGYSLTRNTAGIAGQRETRPTTARPAAVLNPLSSAARAHRDQIALERMLASELSLRSEAKTALQAFNALAVLWHVKAASTLDRDADMVEELKRLAKKRGLEMTPFHGSMDELIRLDSPALLVLSPHAGQGEFLVALTSIREGKLLLAPPLSGRTAFSTTDIAPVWSGRAQVLWRNYDKIAVPVTPGARGRNIRKLQGLLRNAGVQDLTVTGTYDASTVRATKDFQASRGIRETGIVGPITLIHLYRESKYLASPRLASTGKTD